MNPRSSGNVWRRRTSVASPRRRGLGRDPFGEPHQRRRGGRRGRGDPPRPVPARERPGGDHDRDGEGRRGERVEPGLAARPQIGGTAQRAGARRGDSPRGPRHAHAPRVAAPDDSPRGAAPRCLRVACASSAALARAVASSSSAVSGRRSVSHSSSVIAKSCRGGRAAGGARDGCGSERCPRECPWRGRSRCRSALPGVQEQRVAVAGGDAAQGGGELGPERARLDAPEGVVGEVRFGTVG